MTQPSETHTARAEIIDGLKASIPVVLSSMPFGLLFGAIAVKNGFSTFEAVFMSATVFAGASQMVGLELFGTHVAPWLIVLSIFAVNFRHVLYSAAIGRMLRPWGTLRMSIAFFLLVDPQFAETERRREQGRKITWRWYMSMALTIYVFWIADTWVGASFGNLITDPHALGLDFVLPVYFLIMVMGFRKRKSFIPVVLSSGVCAVLAENVVGSPWHVSIGALAGIVVAMMMPIPEEEPATEPGQR
ncbi:AzlC family ABC transporter permease [Zhengella sp. ZM62]|uniref:AzlC family ABC transporter permease n=1 Tax=Zhengella sedimenti TaxID=3390035 RepID=UPI003976B975